MAISAWTDLANSVECAIRGPDTGTAAEKSAHLRRVAGLAPDPRRQSVFARLPGSPLVFWLPQSILELLTDGPFVSSLARTGWGIASCDNDRFLRLFWEPDRPFRRRPWVDLVKAGGYRRWVGLEQWVLDWAGDGQPIRDFIGEQYSYLQGRTEWLVKPENFRQVGWTYSLMAQGSLAVRALEGDEITDNTSPGVFSDDHFDALGGLLNARVTTYVLRAITPDTKFREGYVERVPVPIHLAQVGRAVPALRGLVGLDSSADLTERRFWRTRLEAQDRYGLLSQDPAAAFRASLEGWNERDVFRAFGLEPIAMQAVLDDTAVPAGWHPLIAGYDRLPEAPAGIEIPAGLTDFLGTLDHRALDGPQLTELKARLRRLYEAGPGAKVEDDGPADSGEDEDEAGEALGARIPIPTETFLEELSQRLEVHPISVHRLLEELRAEGVVSPPERKRELEDYLGVTLLRMLGYRWPEQDAYEAEHGPLIDPDLVDADGIIPLVPCADEPTAEARITTRLERAFGDEGAEAFLRDVRRYLGRELGEWLRRDCFKRHAQQFKNRPIAWHLRSPAGHFEAFVLYHRLSRATLATLRTTYAGGWIARLRAEQARAKERGDAPRVSDLQVAIEDVELFRMRLEAIERGDTLADRIRCRWKDETAAGRPGPYAPDIDDGVKVNIRPFQEQGLLAAKVIAKW